MQCKLIGEGYHSQDQDRVPHPCPIPPPPGPGQGAVCLILRARTRTGYPIPSPLSHSLGSLFSWPEPGPRYPLLPPALPNPIPQTSPGPGQGTSAPSQSAHYPPARTRRGYPAPPLPCPSRQDQDRVPCLAPTLSPTSQDKDRIPLHLLPHPLSQDQDRTPLLCSTPTVSHPLSSPGRTCHGQDMTWEVHLLRFH